MGYEEEYITGTLNKVMERKISSVPQEFFVLAVCMMRREGLTIWEWRLFFPRAFRERGRVR